MAGMSVVVWLHGDSLSITDPALSAHPEAPALFVFDRPFLSVTGLPFPDWPSCTVVYVI